MTDDEKIELYKAQRKVAYHHLVQSSKMYFRAQALFYAIKYRYEHDKDEYESTDKKLAMIDGRLKVEPIGKSGKHSKEPVSVELTEEQILSIAAQLNITLPEIEVEQDYEEKQAIVQEEINELGDLVNE